MCVKNIVGTYKINSSDPVKNYVSYTYNFILAELQTIPGLFDWEIVGILRSIKFI